MTGLKSMLLVGIMVLLCSHSFAQESREVNQQTQFWTSVNTTIRLSEHWGGVADFHLRRNDFMQEPNFYFARIGGAYFIDSRFSCVAGYAHLWLARNTTEGLKFEDENRIYQQVLWRAPLGRSRFLQRVRIEQRWQEVIDEEGDVDRVRFTNRIRFLLGFSLQIFNKPTLPRLAIANEVHIHFGKEVVYNTFNQNRIFLGISQRLNPQWSFDFGYMNVYQQKFSGYQYDMNHTIRLFFYYTPDFRKRPDEEMPHFPILGEE